MPHLYAILLPLRPPDNTHSHAHRGEAVLLRHLRTQVCTVGREEEARQGALEAAHQEGEQDGQFGSSSGCSPATTTTAAAQYPAGSAAALGPTAPPPDALEDEGIDRSGERVSHLRSSVENKKWLII